MKRIAAFDVDYLDDDTAYAACLLFEDFQNETPSEEARVKIDKIAPYQPGEFYRRELPCLLKVIDQLSDLPDIMIVDSYVDLDEGRKGMGRHLFDSFNGKIPVIGVAKTEFCDGTSLPLLRGESEKPLYITAAGMALEEARDRVAEMHGDYRMPTLLRRVDQLARGRL